MRLESLFTSRKLFGLAVAIIIFAGGALTLVLANYEEPIVVESGITSSFTEPEAQPQTKEVQDEEETPEEQATTQVTPEPVAPANESVTLSCTDCTLAPVDKQYALPSTYVPSVVSTGLTGGGTVDPVILGDLQSLFSAASANGTPLEIISAYRSYQTQVSTFEYWVSTEQARGLSRLEAEAEANTYSARPGHSEHQLGTTVDIKCAGCADFDAAQNQAAYGFIEDNAHLYGFAISYPQGQQALTGYTYEPWHIRWIGVDLATELYNTGYTAGNGVYLAQFLRTR